MAQDFYRLFKVGKNETTITTLDADGVALAGIKALKEENDALKRQNAKLVEMIVSLDQRLKDLEKK